MYRNLPAQKFKAMLCATESTDESCLCKNGFGRPRACQPCASRRTKLLDGSTRSACQPSEPAQVKLNPFLFDRTTIINIGAASQLYNTGRLEVTECMVISPPPLLLFSDNVA